MKLYAVVVLVVVLAAGAACVDRAATERAESRRIIEAARVQKESVDLVNEVSRAALSAAAEREAELQAALDSIPVPLETLIEHGEYCRAGCTVRWTD